MPDIEGMRAAVYADPEDRALRAVFADALQASGDPVQAAHGELIALELAGRSPERAAALYKRHWVTILGNLRRSLRWKHVQTRWGMPHTAMVDAGRLEAAGALFTWPEASTLADVGVPLPPRYGYSVRLYRNLFFQQLGKQRYCGGLRVIRGVDDPVSLRCLLEKRSNLRRLEEVHVGRLTKPYEGEDPIWLPSLKHIVVPLEDARHVQRLVKQGAPVRWHEG